MQSRFVSADKLISENAWSAVYGDFDEDGRADIALNCDLSLATATGYAKSTSPFHVDAGFLGGVAAIDVDGDGKPDLLRLSAGNFGDPVLVVIDHNLGNGSFAWWCGRCDVGDSSLQPGRQWRRPA